MPLSTKTLQKLQKTTLQILKDFAAYCEKHNLQYYLIGGALLGAVRAQKWIPWDDDIDVAMPREDYERLQTCFSEDPLPEYFLQSEKTDPLYSREILKLRMNNTVLSEISTALLPIHQGIYIDIFPVDYTDRTELSFRAWRIRRLMSLRCIKSGYRNKRLNWLRSVVRCMAFFLPNQWIDKKIISLCTKDNHRTRNHAVLLLHNYHWKNQFHDADVLGDGSTCIFEGQQFRAPADPDAFLKTVFGEEYLVPRAEKKMPHNYLSVVFPPEQQEGKESDKQ